LLEMLGKSLYTSERSTWKNNHSSCNPTLFFQHYFTHYTASLLQLIYMLLFGVFSWQMMKINKQFISDENMYIIPPPPHTYTYSVWVEGKCSQDSGIKTLDWKEK
jgi:hypothetical protein